MGNTRDSAPARSINTLFRHSESDDPFSHYDSMLQHHRVYFDEGNDIWAIHGHQDCLQLLQSAGAAIPARPAGSVLSGAAKGVTDRLIRLNNAPSHAYARPFVRQMLGLARPPGATNLLDELLPAGRGDQVIDWVDVVARKLPALSLLYGLGFDEADRSFLIDRVPALNLLMKPQQSDAEARIVSSVVAEVLPVVARHIESKVELMAMARDHNDGAAEVERRRRLLEANLIGLLIQSYDAGRGLLSSVLLRVLKCTDRGVFRSDEQTMKLCVTETLRFDPPIHNTRRVLTEDTEIVGQLLAAGQHVLLVLAAANRDPQTFVKPGLFLLERANSGDHLTFGAGAHACVASQLTVGLVADTIQAMLERHPDTRLVEERREYEPLINARLPQRVRISYSN